MESAVRREFEEKEAFHNIVVSCPFFISQQPTQIIALRAEDDRPTAHPQQLKIYYNGARFVSTRIVYFPTVEQAKLFYSQYHSKAQEQPELEMWCEYCKDLRPAEGLLYQLGRIYVSAPDQPLRDMLNDIAQFAVVEGAAGEQALRRTNNPLFRFLDHTALSLEYSYYRWRTYAYLQGDGEKRYRITPFRMIDNGAEWFPPVATTIQRGVLIFKQRKHLHELLFKLSRKKGDIEEAMVFAVHHIHAAVEVAAIVALEILEKTSRGEDYIRLFFVISDILFNTTGQDYRRLFARLLPYLIYRIAKTPPGTAEETRHRSQLRALIQIWQIKFIFEENYTRGLLSLLSEQPARAQAIHPRLRDIGNIEDDQEGEMELEKLCLENGLPFLEGEGEREESTRLINDYLWQFSQREERIPEVKPQIDGEPITEKELAKIRSKQVKVVCCGGLNLSHLFERNWQTRHRPTSSCDND